MDRKSLFEHCEGFDEIRREIEVLSKYGDDFTDRRGTVKATVDLYHPKELKLKVSAVIDETPSTKTFRMVPTTGYLPPFQAGQYVNLFVETRGVRSSRPYSIASPPNQRAYYDLTVKAVPDGFVSLHLLEDVKAGDSLTSTGPMGGFFHNPLSHSNDVVYLAGGSGITPMMSMIREVTDRGLERRMHLFYGSRTTDDIIYKEKLEQLATRYDNLTVDIVISEPEAGYRGLTGFIDGKLLKERLGDLSTKTFFVCGPEAMYTFCLKELDTLGLRKKQIRVEAYGPPGDVTAEPGWPEGLSGDATFKVKVSDGRTLEVRAGEPLICSLERHHLVLRAGCRSGECSYCRAKLVSGTVFHAPGTGLRKSDLQFGYIHPCMAYPIEDLEISADSR
jgi:ferredoxin-NADP reductase